MTSQTRALSFGAVAENYDRYRPSYPPPLVDDVCALLPGRRVIEIGAGTGIATSQFAAYDLDMTCVEPDPQMAGVLARKFDGDDHMRVEIATLESWAAARSADSARFDGLICAQAWHWTTPETHWRDTAGALVSGGVLALFWNRDGYADPALLPALVEVYDRHGITDLPWGHTEDALGWTADEIEASSDFTDHEVRNYRWTRTQTVLDHVARLNTVSLHLILPADVREALTIDLIETLTSRSGEQVELSMNTELALARRNPLP